jgi:4-diphosphocytidyl-2-C-methyl-D-erythritol kinase
MALVNKVWQAPAKLNLFLHITGRRNDGYHLLQTVFQFLDYSDELCFSLIPSNDIVLETAFEGVKCEDNLIYKAALMLQGVMAQKQGISIRIKKNLPMGGGLGGGSSDAATTLVALNDIWKVGLSLDQLAVMGLSLGADVPVFVKGRAAWAEGVGEKLTPVTLPEPWFAVVCPGVEVSTEKIFCNSRLTRNSSAITIRDFLGGITTQNVCEILVKEQHAEVAKALDFLDNAPSLSKARMTGTGSCVFSRYSDKKSAEQALNNLPQGWQGFVAKSCNKSPLFKAKV